MPPKWAKKAGARKLKKDSSDDDADAKPTVPPTKPVDTGKAAAPASSPAEPSPAAKPAATKAPPKEVPVKATLAKPKSESTDEDEPKKPESKKIESKPSKVAPKAASEFKKPPPRKVSSDDDDDDDEDEAPKAKPVKKADPAVKTAKAPEAEKPTEKKSVQKAPEKEEKEDKEKPVTKVKQEKQAKKKPKTPSESEEEEEDDDEKTKKGGPLPVLSPEQRSAQEAKFNRPTPEIRIRGLVKVLPYMFLGDAASAANKEELLAQGIDHIVNCASEDVECFHTDTFTYTTFPLEDETESPSEHFNAFYDVLSQCKEDKLKVLVHCTSGKNIAPSMIMSYILKAARSQDKLTSLQNTYKFLGSKEPGVNPTDNYLADLIDLEVELYEEASMRVNRAGKKAAPTRGRGRGGHAGKGKRGK